MAREPITIGLVSHWAFCPRRAWLEAAGEHTDTAQVQVGSDQHSNTDDPRTASAGEFRAVDVYHDGWGLTGRLDTVAESDDGFVVREYKATPVRRRAEVTAPMRLQAHGVRMQFSVFLVDTKPARMLRLVSRLANLIEEDKDSIMLCDLGLVSSLGTTTVTYLGNSREEPPRTSVIV